MSKRPPSRNGDTRPLRAIGRGVSLIEVLLVVTVLGLVAVGALTYFQPSLTSELEDAAQIVFADVERARNLAAENNSKYKLNFFEDGSGYYLQHSGSKTSLSTLPSWPYDLATDPADKQTTLLKGLPGITSVELIGVVKVASSNRSKVSDLEFTSAGSTSRVEPTEIWLAAGTWTSRRYITITVNPTTGLAEVGDIAGAAPSVSVDGGSSTASLDLLGTSTSLTVDESGIEVGVDLGLGS